MTALELSNKFIVPHEIGDFATGQRSLLVPVPSSTAGSRSRGLVGAYVCALSLVLGGSACRESSAQPAPAKGPRPVTAEIVPKIADNKLKIERFAAMPTQTPPIFDAMEPDGPGQQRAFWTMVLSDGSRGFPKGIIATTGPFPGARSDRIYHIDPKGTVNVLVDGLAGSQQVIWATGKYGKAGDLLVSEPISG